MVRRPTKPVPRAQRRWVETTLAGSTLHNVDLTGSRLTGVIVDDVEIDGLVLGLTVNGVDVVPLVRAELERRHPELALIHSGAAADLRAGWAAVKRSWTTTMRRAGRLTDGQWNESVGGEWSLIETLRHLVFVTDAWLRRPVLGDRDPYWPAGLGATDMPVWFAAACGLDAAAPPTVDEVKRARRERIALLDQTLGALDDAALSRRCRRNPRPGYPADTRKFTVGQCVRAVLDEEWAHHRFARRDLDALLSAG